MRVVRRVPFERPVAHRLRNVVGKRFGDATPILGGNKGLELLPTGGRKQGNELVVGEHVVGEVGLEVEVAEVGGLRGRGGGLDFGGGDSVDFEHCLLNLNLVELKMPNAWAYL